MTVGLQPPPLPNRGADSIYSFENLPACHHRMYIYAYRFVKLVRTKTPKLTLYTQRSKCQFMENGPRPNCEVYFYNGVKVYNDDCLFLFNFYIFYICMLQVTQIGGVVKVTESDGKTFMEGELPPHLENYYEHYSECYQRCLLLESTLTTLETATRHSCFPVTIGRRPYTALTDAPGSGKENISHTANSTSVVSRKRFLN